MKRILILIVVASLCILALTGCDALNDILAGLNSGGAGSGNGGGGSSAPEYDDSKCTEGLAFTLDSQGNYAVSGYTGSEATVYVPAMYENHPVTSVKGNAFKNNTVLTAIYLPESVKEISAKAFDGASMLQSVEFYSSPESLTIGASAFIGCSSLKTFKLPDTTCEVGANAFGGCTRLQYSEGGCVYVGEWLLLCDSQASTVNIRPGTVGIANSAFSGSYLTSVSIPTSVKHIGKAAFMRCSFLTSVTCISGSALETVGDDAFYECKMLSSVQLSSSLKSVNVTAFLESPCISSITIPQGCEKYSSPGNTLIVDKTTKTLIYGCPSAPVYLPADGSVEYIGDYAFYKHTNAGDLIIPTPIKEIGNYAFANCTNLNTLTVADNANLEKIGDYAFYKAAIMTLLFGSNNHIREFGAYSFSNLISIGLRIFIVPASVEKMGEGVISFCEFLTHIQFEEGSRLTEIPKSAFESDNDVITLNIPRGVRAIGDRAFFNCYRLTKVLIPDTVVNMGSRVFASMQDSWLGNIRTEIFCQAASIPDGWKSDWKQDSVAEPTWNYDIGY